MVYTVKQYFLYAFINVDNCERPPNHHDLSTFNLKKNKPVMRFHSRLLRENYRQTISVALGHWTLIFKNVFWSLLARFIINLLSREQTLETYDAADQAYFDIVRRSHQNGRRGSHPLRWACRKESACNQSNHAYDTYCIIVIKLNCLFTPPHYAIVATLIMSLTFARPDSRPTVYLHYFYSTIVFSH